MNICWRKLLLCIIAVHAFFAAWVVLSEKPPLPSTGDMSTMTVPLGQEPNGESMKTWADRVRLMGRVDKLFLTCFVASTTFYHGSRQVSTRWIELLIHSATNAADGAVVVAFVDPVTAATLAERRWNPRLHVIELRNRSDMRYSKWETMEYETPPWAEGIPNAANAYRFDVYRQWLQQLVELHGTLRTWIALVDATDVGIQRDPFDPSGGCIGKCRNYTHGCVVFTLEHSRKKLLTEVYNRRWLECYRRDSREHEDVVGLWSAMHSRPISCAGVTLGDVKGIMWYVNEQIRQQRKPSISTCARDQLHAAADQATHNVILYSNQRLQNNVDLKNRVAVVVVDHERDACVFHGNWGRLRLRGNGAAAVAVNVRGESYAIVHQFTSNRHPALQKAIESRFGTR